MYFYWVDAIKNWIYFFNVEKNNATPISVATKERLLEYFFYLKTFLDTLHLGLFLDTLFDKPRIILQKIYQ